MPALPRYVETPLVQKSRFLLLALLIAAVFVLWRFSGAGARGDGSMLGYVEGDVLYIAPNEAERVERLFVEAGSAVEAGAPLFSMATPVLDAQRQSAIAKVEQATQQLENIAQALNRPQQIAVLQAAVERAQAALDWSKLTYQRQKTLFSHGHVAKAALDQAEAALSRDQASLDEAKRQVVAANLSGRSHEIDAAEAALRAAKGDREALDIRIARATRTAPTAGVVQDVFFRPGEMANAGQPVVALLPPENRKARFYAAQARLADIKLGDLVDVSCDGCAAGLSAKVYFIASREEYTPPVVFSDVERAKLVYKVEARLQGAARDLPLGLPLAIRLAPAGAPK
jgi:HlyD family secretion protein